MSETTKDYRLCCRKCGQAGLLSITSNRNDWSFATVGFIGLAVSWTSPSTSIIRCNSCRSMEVEVGAASLGPR